MSNVIQFLERLGANPTSPAEYAAAMAALTVDADQRRALIDNDVSSLSDLLGGRSRMYCMVAAPDSDVPDEEIPENPDEPVEDAPDLARG